MHDRLTHRHTHRSARAEAPAAASHPLVLPDGADQRIRAVFRAFVTGGRVTTVPAKRAKRLILLDLVAQRFEPGQRYPEVEVNAILREICDDYVTLRRLLVDEDFLARENAIYWRSGGTVPV